MGNTHAIAKKSTFIITQGTAILPPVIKKPVIIPGNPPL